MGRPRRCCCVAYDQRAQPWPAAVAPRSREAPEPLPCAAQRVCAWTPEAHDLADGKKPVKGEMWFQATDQPLFAVAGFWQHTAKGAGFAMVTCDANELVAPVHAKAMITILHADDQER